MTIKPISLLICALGGEGGGVLTEWIIAAARHAGFAAQSTSIPGVAQRTGATTYYVEVFPTPIALLGGKRPVLCLNPVPGALDALVSSELLETTRQIGNGMATQARTRVITSSARALTTIERMQLGDGRVDEAQLVAIVQRHSLAHSIIDMPALAKRAGTMVSAVMLGAVAGSGIFPFARADFEAAVAGAADNAGNANAPVNMAIQASLRGFGLGFDAIAQPLQQAQSLQDMLSGAPHAPLSPLSPQIAHPSLPSGIAAQFPQAVHAMMGLGYARVCDYQSAAYGQLYVNRMQQVVQAEQAADRAMAQGMATSIETARWLALWMAFDDIVRVADLKSRASRWARVKAEVKAKDGELLRVFDHFKPGVPEFAALLPTGMANKLIAWDRQRALRGQDAWALPLKIGTHSVLGMLSLRALASLRWLRVRGSRYALEQQLIQAWLAAIESGAQRHWQLGYEIAQCGRLIKGYGSTNERGKESLAHILGHLAQGAEAVRAAAAIQDARQAALADDNGSALDASMRQHAAPARPVKEQPIRFVRKPPLRTRP